MTQTRCAGPVTLPRLRESSRRPGPEEIRAKLGAPWIPPGDVRAFAADTLGYAPAVGYLPVTAHWEVKAERGLADTAAATEEWGTGRIDGYRLLELAVNGRAPVIYDTVSTPDGETRVRNQAETMLAEEKQRALAARFAEWAWEDPARADRLCAEYNRRFNSVVLRRYDGSTSPSPAWPMGSRRTRTSGTWCTGSSPRQRACAPTRWGPARRRPCSWPPASSKNSAW